VRTPPSPPVPSASLPHRLGARSRTRPL
jgi:hypothetical protein